MTGPDEVFDLAIIGGGINGAGIACDAAGRGLKTLLIEADDLGSATSSASSKLIHGGLRYLEHGDLGLVRKSLTERSILLAKAPHIVRPLEFILPHDRSQRPRWMIRLGLFLYDRLGGSPNPQNWIGGSSLRQSVPSSGALDLTREEFGAILKPDFRHGFSYWDCWVDDARLVVLNARAAADHGAQVKTRTRFLRAVMADGLWQLHFEDAHGDAHRETRARAIVNAAGPWAGEVLDTVEPAADPHDPSPRVRRVKGSHIVVPALTTGEAYILQHPDGRVVFVLPFEDDFSLIGTTDIPFDGDPRSAAIDSAEIEYLIDAVNRYFARSISEKDVVWSFSGVRPLYDDDTEDPSRVTRDYRLELRNASSAPQILSVFGGKITTYRALAEEAVDQLRTLFPRMGPAWTKSASLPGGDIGETSFPSFRAALQQEYPGLDRQLLGAIGGRYGTLAREILVDAKTTADLGYDFGGGLYEREVTYLKENEWARTPSDILWRRTKAGLHMTAPQRARAEDALARLL